LELLEKALSIKPKRIPALHEKALCLIDLKRYNEAIKTLDEILEIDSNDFTAYYNKACAYSLLNDKLNAINNLKKAIELNPDFKFLAMDDKDFDNIRSEEEFKNLIK